MIVGIDIGGTHTDGVLVKGRSIVASCKVPTTRPLDRGVAEVLRQLVADPDAIEQVVVGTTHATNAILEADGLSKVGVLRIAGQEPAIPPCFDWPQPLVEAVLASCETIGGGVQFDARPLTPFSIREAKEAIERLLERGAEAIAVVGVFSPVCSRQEELVGELLDAFPHTLSHKLGGMGFLERENAAILNSALKRCLAEGFADLRRTVIEAGVSAPLWMTQNNGTVMALEQAIELPVLTLSAGPTNSFVGAAQLASLPDAVVVDIGGTSTDIGVVREGFARRSLNQSEIGGVRLNFPMPDVLSLAIGGGSHVTLGTQPEVGPQSCARRLKQEARAFGGGMLTLTDVALHLGHLEIEGARPVALDPDLANRAFAHTLERIATSVARAEAGRSDLPIVLVGGGAALLPTLEGRYLVPHHAGAANAYGAALAEISGSVDTVVSLAQDREGALGALRQQATEQAIAAGADPSGVRIAHLEIVPYAYMPGGMARVSIVAAGARTQ